VTQQQSGVCRKFNKSRNSNSGGTKKVGVLLKKRSKPRSLWTSCRKQLVAGEVKVVAEEVARLKVKTRKMVEMKPTVVKVTTKSALGQPPNQHHHQKRARNRMSMVARLVATMQLEAGVAESVVVEVAQEAGVHKVHREMVPLRLRSRRRFKHRGRESGYLHCI
jgi:hypothetical protein